MHATNKQTSLNKDDSNNKSCKHKASVNHTTGKKLRQQPSFQSVYGRNVTEYSCRRNGPVKARANTTDTQFCPHTTLDN